VILNGEDEREPSLFVLQAKYDRVIFGP